MFSKHKAHDGQPFLIEGKLTNLHWELGSENLLAKVHKHYKGNAVVTGAGAAVGEMFGQVANAAMLAMYDGEDTQNFMCLIDDQPACGQFGGAEHLPDGKNIKAVVSHQNGVLYVHAAMDTERNLVWINHPWGTRAEMWANAKLGLFGFLFGNIGFAVFWLFGGKGTLWETMQMSLFGGGALMAVITLWSFKDLKAIAGPSTEYFRLLGFENPESVNMNFPYYAEVEQEYSRRGEAVPKAWQGVLSECQYRNVYSVNAAIRARKAKLLLIRSDEV